MATTSSFSAKVGAEMYPASRFSESGSSDYRSSHGSSTDTAVSDQVQNIQEIIIKQRQAAASASLQRSENPLGETSDLDRIAQELYDGTFDGVTSPQDYLAYMGGSIRLDESEAEMEVIRSVFMEKFDWTDDLVQALRLLCSKLFFKGESQAIDKVLDSFAKSWYRRYDMFGSPGGVYLVSYSLIILNTDLHTDTQLKKMSRQKYVRNTRIALEQNGYKAPVESVLRHYYNSLAGSELQLNGILPSMHREKSLSHRDSYGFVRAIKRRSQGSMGSLVASKTAVDPDSSFARGDADNTFFLEEDGDLELELQGAPWTKEGLQWVLDESKQHKFQRPQWKQFFTVVSEGQLKLFTFNQSASKSNSIGSKGDGNWMSFANCVASVNLMSCLAQSGSGDAAKAAKPPAAATGYNWSLTLPLNDSETLKHRTILFTAGTEEIAREFCDTCNFWAARTCAPPAKESIDSIEYGWSKIMTGYLSNCSDRKRSLDEYLASSYIEEWKPVVSGLVPTETSMSSQLTELAQYLMVLEDKYRMQKDLGIFQERLHRSINKPRHESLVGLFLRNRTSRAARNVKMVIHNHQTRLQYLQDEIDKYQIYIEILGRALELRSSLAK